MNEIDLVRSFRSDIPKVGAEQPRRARANLLGIIGGRTRDGGASRWRGRRATAAAAAIAICAPAGYALADNLGITGGEHSPAPSPGENPVAPAPVKFPPGLSEQDKRDLMPTDPSLIP